MRVKTLEEASFTQTQSQVVIALKVSNYRIITVLQLLHHNHPTKNVLMVW